MDGHLKSGNENTGDGSPVLYTCIGVGFSYPNTFDISYARTRYKYRGKVNLSSKIKSFVNKNTKGLKP